MNNEITLTEWIVYQKGKIDYFAHWYEQQRKAEPERYPETLCSLDMWGETFVDFEIEEQCAEAAKIASPATAPTPTPAAAEAAGEAEKHQEFVVYGNPPGTMRTLVAPPGNWWQLADHQQVQKGDIVYIAYNPGDERFIKARAVDYGRMAVDYHCVLRPVSEERLK